MRRYLFPAFVLLLVAALAFSVGFYSGFRKNVVFEMIVRGARAMNPAPLVTAAPEMRLDMTDRAFLDSTLLPLHQDEILVTSSEGTPLPLLALEAAGGEDAIALGAEGTLFRMTGAACPGDGCLRQIGRLVRPDGTALDDIYDLLSLEREGGRDWYVSYGQPDAAGFNKSFAISRFVLPEDEGGKSLQPVEKPVFLSRSFSLRNGHAPRSAGGAMAYDPKTDEIIVAVGDYSLNGIANVYSGAVPPSQSPDSDIGKILRIDRETGQSHIVSMGHRNPQGLSISSDGELISTEHAPKGGDEINLIAEGRNYGWPYASMGTVYGTYSFPEKPLRAGEVHGGYTPPIAAYLPSPGISAVTHIEGFHPAWDGDLMVATLKARSLMRVRRWVGGSYTEQIYIGDRIRDVDIVGKAMLLATDSGKIIRLTPVENVQLARTETGLNTNLNALSNCGGCHNLNYPVSTRDAPHLRNLMGRPIASASDYSTYSPALLAKSTGTWDIESLEKFLRAPQEFAPGTAMPDLGLSDGEIAELMTELPLLR
ncbi:hypothetical protein FQV27_07085 [Paracoccus aurantiacus]|uniref:Cytochrome c domain-containing protein n=1 Tax=Paracoccus aurantiacus TaxID=2599412 RepID=A0A5C6S5I9_9RHOB|nr:PQQ-dependent sugar dehydrogenase [Paracoccus aurantiacus]TXB69870.1 hypothetical protein FQV27_07085 [Paracoccus aurantiacus]